MAPKSKRAKPTTEAETETGAANSSGAVLSSQLILFQSGPSLERIPDDVLHEILSYLPTLTTHHVLQGGRQTPPVIPTDSLVRTPTLRALSQTSRVLRSRCLAMAWQRIELCSARLPENDRSFYSVVGKATQACVRVLNACPHLLPLIQTVAVCLTRYKSAEIVPAFAECLAALPNLTAIQVIHAHTQMTTAIKNGFEGKRFPSVRTISLPSSAHEIIKCCRNLEQVTCTDGNGSTIVGSLVKGNCDKVRVLKGITAPLTRLVKLLPDLEHSGAGCQFPLLSSIENRVFTTNIEHVYSKLKAVMSKVLEKVMGEKRVIVKQ